MSLTSAFVQLAAHMHLRELSWQSLTHPSFFTLQTLDNANQLAGQSGLVNYLQQLQSQYSIVSKCSTTSSS